MTRPKLHRVVGKDSKSHRMTLRRLTIVGNTRRYRDVRSPMTEAELQSIRRRAANTTYEAFQREWILLLDGSTITGRVL
jgi:hypothetical protein